MPDYGVESCRACTSFKSFMKAQASFKSKDEKSSQQESQSNSNSTSDDSKSYGVDCPVDKDNLGRASWTFLHTMAAYYPDKPTSAERAEMKQFVNLFSKFYPCGHCAKDMRNDIAVDPPVVDSRKAFSLWMCNLHNKVNAKLGKPIFDCSKVDERWLTGPPDGKCD